MAGKNQFVLQSFVKDVQKEIDKNARKNMQNAGKFARSEVRKVLNVKHRSKPNSPPGRLSGKLWKSIRYQVETDAYGVKIGSTDFKARWMEFGTSKMDPRPFLLPTIDKHKEEIMDIMAGKLVE